MKMKSQFQEKLEREIAARKLKIAEQKELVKQKYLAQLANEFEDNYNEKMGRSGVRWAGD